VSKLDRSWRLITHLSYPEEKSVNDGISDNIATVSYASFDKVVDMIFNLGYKSEMAKSDIK
jgi:hypothetical protein